MTDEETLEALESDIADDLRLLPEHLHGLHHRETSVEVLRQLCADSRALRELVAALPKCDQCELPATHGWVSDGDAYYECDNHGATANDLPYASVLRRIGRGG